MSAVSEWARTNQRQRNRESYKWYKDRGICPQCKKMYCRPGKVYCDECGKKRRKATAARDNSAYCKERREKLKAQGLCVSCGKLAVKGRVLCAACARRNAEAQQVRKMKKRLAREIDHEINNLKELMGGSAAR